MVPTWQDRILHEAAALMAGVRRALGRPPAQTAAERREEAAGVVAAAERREAADEVMRATSRRVMNEMWPPRAAVVPTADATAAPPAAGTASTPPAEAEPRRG
ncbi:MAG TPA: hypothetical protein VFX49_18200 [Chloroflexota bacterium]|nr:hypothetical protein [Chloroflexota bacterium]